MQLFEIKHKHKRVVTKFESLVNITPAKLTLDY